MESYSVIDNRLFDDENLKTTEAYALMVLIRYFNRNKGYAYPSYNDLKKQLKVKSNKAVAATMKSLEVKGYIKRNVLVGIGTQYIILKYVKEYGHIGEEVDEVKVTGGVEVNSKNRKPVTLCSRERGSKGNTISTKTSKKKSIEDIDKVWEHYPVKRGKAVAIKKIPELIKEYGSEQIIRCVKRYSEEVKGRAVQYVQQGGRFFTSGYIDYLDESYECKEISMEQHVRQDPETGEIYR